MGVFVQQEVTVDRKLLYEHLEIITNELGVLKVPAISQNKIVFDDKVKSKLSKKAKRLKKCKYCGFVTNHANIRRWHNDNCKYKNDARTN